MAAKRKSSHNGEHTTLYLQKLKFEEKLRNSWIAKYLINPRFVILVIIAILGIGLSSYSSLPRRLNPEVQFPLIIVSTVLPGANPQDIETLVTEPIESQVNSLTNVKTVTSTSQENVSVIQIEFEPGVETDKAKTDVQSAVDGVTLPDDAQDPNVSDIDFENQPVWSFAITGPDPASIARFAKALQDNLENEASIREVQVSGFETQEIAITINPTAIAQYEINPLQLSQSIRSAAGSYPAGNVRTDSLTFPLSIDPSVTTIEDIRDLQISVNDEMLPLSSIATIQESSKPNQLLSYFANKEISHEQAITFDVYKTRTTDIDTAVHDTEEIIKETREQYGEQFTIQSITNTGELIDEQFGHLLRDFTITVILVFIILFIFLGARQAFVAFIAVPFTFLITFAVMQAAGISLNFLSMFSLLLSLGLLVDDTIVVISAMTSYYRTGRFTALETGLLVWRDFGVAIVTTTLTTVFAFLPLLLSSGIIGEFIKSIPIVVSSTLMASLFVAMIVTLPLMMLTLQFNPPNRVKVLFRVVVALVIAILYFVITPKGDFFIVEILAFCIFVFVLMVTRSQLIDSIRGFFDKNKNTRFMSNAMRYSDTGIVSFGRIESVYRRMLTGIMYSKKNRKNTIIFVVLFSIFSYMLVPLGFVKNEFFPKSDQEYLYVTLELPAGTNLNTSRNEAFVLLDQLRKTPDVEYVIANLGRSYSDSGFGASGENTVLYSLVLPAKGDRDLSSIEIADNLRKDMSSYTKGIVSVAEVSGGPPAGADVQIKIFGDDLDQLDAYAEDVMGYLEKQNGVTDVKKSITSGASKLIFEPNPQKVAAAGLSSDQLGLWLRTFASGFTLDTIKFEENGNDDTDITLRLGSEQAVDDIYSLSIPTANGLVALADLGTIKLGKNPSLITREDGERTISVSATSRPGYNLAQINQELTTFADNDLNLANGYDWSTGGVNEENQQSVNSILQAMLLSFLLIVLTMIVQFGSFRKAVIVMLVIPLSISGVFIIFALTNTPLSFPALIGILALFGIVVKNSILIVDKITANQESGMDFENSIIDASVSRLEAIALTSITAIFGLIPITLSDPLWRGLGGSIIAGLTFSGTIMLFFIPVVYFYWFAPRIKKREARVKNVELSKTKNPRK
jgi:multidrug efflux pump subunit AcrB